jgi:hypothetical protein
LLGLASGCSLFVSDRGGSGGGGDGDNTTAQVETPAARPLKT